LPGESRIREYALIGETKYSCVLPNGFSVFVVPKSGFQKRYALLATDYGSADRRFRFGGNMVETPEGVAHFLEHLMFETELGSASTILSENGASSNAYTSTDITAYNIECVDNFTDNLETLLKFVSIPYFTQRSVDKERGIIGQEILMVMDDPDYRLYYGLMKSLFRHSPLRESVAGTTGSISKITADNLYDCHKSFYTPSNMALCVAGDVTPEEIADVARSVLPPEPGEIPRRDYGPGETPEPERKRISEAMDVNLPIFMAGCKTGPADDGPDNLRLEIVSALALDILAGHSSPLYFRLYGQGLVNNDFSALFDSSSGAAYVLFGGETRDPDRVFDEVNKEIARISENGPDEGLFERVKKAAAGSFIRSLNSFDAICGGIICGHFRGYDVFDTPDVLSGITENDITTFLRERLISDNMAISIIYPNDNTEIITGG